MAVPVASGAPTLFVRKAAFEQAGLTRSRFDNWLTLTADEFRVEQELIAIGPIHGGDDLSAIVDELEGLGLTYFDDFFELSGNWPEWLRLYAAAEGGG